MDPIIVTAAAVIITNTLSLLALWLRLRGRSQWEHAHLCNLVDLTRSIPEDGQLCERRADGTHLVITRTKPEEHPGG